MRLFNIAVCFLILSTLCAAEDSSAYFDELGNKLYSTKNYRESLDYFNKSLNQDKNNVDAWIHKGDAQRALKDYNGSLLLTARPCSLIAARKLHGPERSRHMLPSRITPAPLPSQQNSVNFTPRTRPTGIKRGSYCSSREDSRRRYPNLIAP